MEKNKNLKTIDRKRELKDFLSCLIRSPLFYITFGMMVIDFLTKWLIVFNFAEGESITLIPNFLLIHRIQNLGAIFGLGNGASWSRVLLIVIRCVLAVLIPIIYFFKGRKIKLRYKVCIALIYAGCIGNMIDGIFYWKPLVGFDGVVDWIEFTFFPYTFNIADSYVTVAVFLVIIFLIIDEIKEVRIRNKRGEYSMTPEEYEKKLAEENKEKNGLSDKK